MSVLQFKYIYKYYKRRGNQCFERFKVIRLNYIKRYQITFIARHMLHIDKLAVLELVGRLELLKACSTVFDLSPLLYYFGWYNIEVCQWYIIMASVDKSGFVAAILAELPAVTFKVSRELLLAGSGSLGRWYIGSALSIPSFILIKSLKY